MPMTIIKAAAGIEDTDTADKSSYSRIHRRASADGQDQ